MSSYFHSLIRQSSLGAGPGSSPAPGAAATVPLASPNRTEAEMGAAPLESLEVEEAAQARPPATPESRQFQAGRPEAGALPAVEPEGPVPPDRPLLRSPGAPQAGSLRLDLPDPLAGSETSSPPERRPDPSPGLDVRELSPVPGQTPEPGEGRPASKRQEEPGTPNQDPTWEALFNQVVAWVEANTRLPEQTRPGGLEELPPAGAELSGLPGSDHPAAALPVPVHPARLAPEPLPGPARLERPGEPPNRSERPAQPPSQDLHLSIGTIYVSVEDPHGAGPAGRPGSHAGQAVSRVEPAAGRSRLSRHYLRPR